MTHCNLRMSLRSCTLHLDVTFSMTMLSLSFKLHDPRGNDQKSKTDLLFDTGTNRFSVDNTIPQWYVLHDRTHGTNPNYIVRKFGLKAIKNTDYGLVDLDIHPDNDLSHTHSYTTVYSLPVSPVTGSPINR